MDIEVDYRNKRRYKTSKKPLHQGIFWTWLIWVLSKMMLTGKKYKVEKVGMEGLKPPYMLLSNHMHFIDFELAAMATWPYPVSNVVSIDGYVVKGFLLEWIGAVATRKFTTDIGLVKSIRHVLKRGDILAMYPEARYTPCGTTAYLPDSLGKLVKMNKVPVVAVVHHGNHLYAPFWDYKHKRKVPMHTVFTQILTADQVQEMSVKEINEAIRTALQYDEYRYQKEQGIKITEPFRAQGLHKVLYKCPRCGEEFQMGSEGAQLYCKACGKRWLWQEDGYLKALEGETEFDHIPDWFRWERKTVSDEIDRGEYFFREEVEVRSLPRTFRYIPLGKATLTHDPKEGFTLEGSYRGSRYYIHRECAQTNSLHVEYDFSPLKNKHFVDISTENDSFYCQIGEPGKLTKLAFATEELYLRSQKKA